MPVEKTSLCFEDTPLGSNGTSLLDGLDVYSVPASGDDHPLAVYGIESEHPLQLQGNSSLRPVLLLHGRTWSSVPVYHLLGGPKHRDAGEESRSLMEALLAKGLQPYAMDFRGFGGTPHDETGYVEPKACVKDAETVLKWISKRHGLDDLEDDDQNKAAPPCLFGWSQGALVAQLLAQSSPSLISKLILYGSIYDPLVRYPREPLYTLEKPNRTVIQNGFDDAIEDFTVEGTIAPEPARRFAEAALLGDPIKAIWKHTYQFNNCDPARIHIPTLVVAGDQDPYAPLHVQQELFANLGRGCDRTWSILSDSDHAVHLLEGRDRLINIIVSFVQNGMRRES
jgi:pimeloyl-ACP methyl ester carboxylesterase